MLGQPGQSGFQNMMVQPGHRVGMIGSNPMQGMQMHQIHQVNFASYDVFLSGLLRIVFC